MASLSSSVDSIHCGRPRSFLSQPSCDFALSMTPTPVVRKDVASRDVEPQKTIVAAGHVVQPPPGDFVDLGQDIRRIFG